MGLREQAEKGRVKIRLLVELGIKYGTEFKEIDDAIDSMLGRDKYLRLAYWLEKNRGDWSDGPEYARVGMEGFKIDPAKPEDAAISKEIWGFISDWDGDGRVFRDCTWNYSTLYGMADADLRADLAKLQEHEDRF